MEVNHDQRISLSTMHLAQLVNQESGHLHSLKLTARTHDLTYNTNIHNSLDTFLVGMLTELKKVTKIFGSHIQELKN